MDTKKTILVVEDEKNIAQVLSLGNTLFGNIFIDRLPGLDYCSIGAAAGAMQRLERSICRIDANPPVTAHDADELGNLVWPVLIHVDDLVFRHKKTTSLSSGGFYLVLYSGHSTSPSRMPSGLPS